ncbi:MULTISPECIES: endonuclease/exonuclease/phosphatase family protein [Methylobacterium]|uniref:endonuclease/exonuclease/phosphatase family protein n=1 Tax=Methylobacterium TaxID=407 RepID=UPI0013ED348C|nr:endonuclease/exonuclease/phosphatase family protein [Methylobacterium sp. DB0501]NGM34424.1 endonuclease/exonuclease/phosphatase family protein [Methylobacterium sp. DB0501]
MPGLIALSWNLENFSTKKLSMATTVAKTVKRVIEGHDDPSALVVGQFLEIIGTEAEAGSIAAGLQREFAAEGLGNARFRSDPLGGVRNEHVVTFSIGLDIEAEDVDFHAHISDEIRDDDENAEKKLGLHLDSKKISKRQKIPSRKARDAGLSPLVARKEHYRTIDKTSSWFRKGKLFKVRPLDKSGRELRIASFHSPGPAISKNKRILNATIRSSRAKRADFIIGDLNYRGSIGEGGYVDIPLAGGGGTTLRKTSSSTFGSHRWDRVLVDEALTNKPKQTVVTAAEELPGGGRVSDHGAISTYFEDLWHAPASLVDSALTGSLPEAMPVHAETRAETSGALGSRPQAIDIEDLPPIGNRSVAGARDEAAIFDQSRPKLNIFEPFGRNGEEFAAPRNVFRPPETTMRGESQSLFARMDTGL